MSTEQLLTQIEGWHQADEHQKIVDTILALPEDERADEVLGQLAVAYNNLDDYDAAIAILEALRPRQENTDKWQFRMGYALYYLNRNQEAKVAFTRCLMLNGNGKYTENCRGYLKWIGQENSGENDGDKETECASPEVYTQAQWDAVEAHITKYFGDYPNVFHEIVSPDIHVDICVIPPSEEKDYYTLVTMGMGAHRMNVPSELAEHKLERAELLITLPSDWKIGDDKEAWYWPTRLLKQLARLPGECDTWLGCGHTVDNREPYADNTALCASILREPVDAEDGAEVCPLPDGEEVNFHQVIPLYREEMEYKQENNAEALFEHMGDIPFVIEPDRDNCCEDDGHLSEVPMDSATLHIESIVEKELPVEEITAYNHLAIYVRWCIEQGLMSDLFKERLPELMRDVESGQHALDLRKQLRDREELNRCLIRPYFNKDGAAFAAYYYSGDEGAPYFPSDIDTYAKVYFGEKRYHSDEFQDEAYLFVPYDEAYYQGMKKVMDERYAALQALKAELEENTAPSAQAQAMMRYLGCPCRYFAPTLDDDEIFGAYHEAAARGKREGFVPMLVSAEDDTLWECLIMNSDEDSEDEEDFSFDAETVAAYRNAALTAPLPRGEEVMALLLKTRKEEAAADDMDWDEEVLGEIAGGEAQNRFIGYWDYGTRATVPLVLAEIPVRNPWEVFAYLPFGAWNECPDTPELMAVAKYWFELHGAMPAVMTHDVLEFALPAPVKRERAMQLALEQYAWCPDVIDQGGYDATVGMLADSLTKSKCWYFWWD